MPPYWDKIKTSKTVKQNTFSSLKVFVSIVTVEQSYLIQLGWILRVITVVCVCVESG